jgi:hypothetical protein
MMKHTLHAAAMLSLWALASPTLAQDDDGDVIQTSKDFSIDVSQPYAVVDAQTKTYFTIGRTLLSVKVDGRDLMIMTHDLDNLKVKTTRMYEDALKGMVYQGVIELDGRFFVTYSDWVKEKKSFVLYQREIDAEAGTFKDKGSELLTIKGKLTPAMPGEWAYMYYGVGLAMSDASYGRFNYNYSHDGKKVMIQYRKKPEEKDDSKSHDVIGLACFGPGMEKIWAQEARMPYTEEAMDIEDYSVDSEGNMYILAKVRKDGSARDQKKGEKEANYVIELLSLKANTTEVKATPIEIGSKFISTISLYEAGDTDDMLCAGTYTMGGKKRDIADGIFYFRLGKDGGVKNMAFSEIPVDILNQYANKREKKRNEKEEDEDEAGFRSLRMRNLFVNSDGSVVLVGEQHYVAETVTMTPNGMRRTIIYYYRDVLVTKLKSDGTLAWMRKLPKHQSGQSGRGGMGMRYFNSGKSHYITFLDNVKNMSLTPDKPPAKHADGAGGFFTAYKIDDATGEVTRHSIFDMRDVKGMKLYQFMTSRIQETGRNEFVVEAYKKKKEDVLIRVHIND